jgi:formyltetrahydrofolate-dependent phosphoribosylglycinamide formyltransferase
VTPIRIAFLLSGSGTTLENLLRHIDMGTVPGRVVVVLRPRGRARARPRARYGVPALVVDAAPADGAAFDAAVEAALRPHAPDLVVMGGFLSLWRLPPEWKGRVLNVHPSLLPSFGGKGFYGDRVHQAVIDAGGKVTGCTVHLVDDAYDQGPIVAQAAVVVEDDDTAATLGHRVQEAERRLFPACIRLFAEGRLRVEGRRVRVLPAAAGREPPSAAPVAAPRDAGKRCDRVMADPPPSGGPAAGAGGPAEAGGPAGSGGPPPDPLRARVRALAQDSLRRDAPTAWFETLYAEAGADATRIPWADLAPNPDLVAWTARPGALAGARTAVVVGCGLGHDAEHLARHGLDVTAFDIAPSAVAGPAGCTRQPGALRVATSRAARSLSAARSTSSSRSTWRRCPPACGRCRRRHAALLRPAASSSSRACATTVRRPAVRQATGRPPASTRGWLASGQARAGGAVRQTADASDLIVRGSGVSAARPDGRGRRPGRERRAQSPCHAGPASAWPSARGPRLRSPKPQAR